MLNNIIFVLLQLTELYRYISSFFTPSAPSALSAVKKKDL
jgi:hypothetical protein